MSRLALVCAGLMLAVNVLSSIGCCEQEKKDLAAMTENHNKMSVAKTNMENQFIAAKKDLLNATAERDGLQAENTSLKAQLANKPPEGPKPLGPDEGTTGWSPHAAGVQRSLEGDVLFSSGQAALTAAGKKELDKIAADLKGKFAGKTVLIYGHTDNDPIKRTKNLWQDNLDLSANRAMAVSRYLIGQGVAADRIETIGMGEHHPLDKANKSKNRRVEIVVIK
ncbi:MAG: OmpA family protein [Planctomycetes bacterium]|nr:OmpA family protein [Planctomycetota bacterium]